MLSILIPVKDYDCHTLIEELHRQGEACGFPYEIIVGEDGTSQGNLGFNMVAEILPNCRRVIRKENIGRANIRNLLALEAVQPYIVFIDCDAVIEKGDFLASYATALKGHDVVCGGLYHAENIPDKHCELRFRYEKKADRRRDAVTRNRAPFAEFTTFNFAIKRELFLSIFFNSSISRYGYEDVLFGKELERRGASIVHIDNRLLHNGIESNDVFLAKVEQSLVTLASIRGLIGETPLLRAVNKLESFYLKGLFMFMWRLFSRAMRHNLLGSRPSLFLLNVYKLGYYMNIGK